ncbi:hypothetical protein [Methylobacter sp. BlB1]|jgi:hypothetical protein|uniref:hypothetical protein n=1 Tax=Methylobacter sp. BlB1 TaxID=2785914 RepID=UPI0018936A7A|nr:hypothetical protein [Methylobacter sp. BlB1]MBF6650177.1 hypothetical protein [Methylobacter sp. BlB1]
MKFFIRHWILFGVSTTCLLSAAISQADPKYTTVFSEPVEYCFEQTSLRGGLDRAILEHHLIVPPEDHFKLGEVFVGFRRKSEPDKLWLYGIFGNWIDSNDTQYIYSRSVYSMRKLEPVIDVSIFLDPTDVTEFVGDGEIWVGYGLRKDESATEEDSFQDMMDNQRYYRLWQIGGSIEKNSTVCLTAIQMEEDTGTGNTGHGTVPITSQ